MANLVQTDIGDKLSPEQKKELEERAIEIAKKLEGMEKKRKQLLRELDLVKFRVR